MRRAQGTFGVGPKNADPGRRKHHVRPRLSEDGSAPAIFRATSADGVDWVRGNGGNPLLQGTAAAFNADASGQSRTWRCSSSG
jgi:hypothetical protein